MGCDTIDINLVLSSHWVTLLNIWYLADSVTAKTHALKYWVWTLAPIVWKLRSHFLNSSPENWLDEPSEYYFTLKVLLVQAAKYNKPFSKLQLLSN